MCVWVCAHLCVTVLNDVFRLAAIPELWGCTRWRKFPERPSEKKKKKKKKKGRKGKRKESKEEKKKKETGTIMESENE